MFTVKIFFTLLLIQSLQQLTFAQQDDDDLGSIFESLPRFEARRQSRLNGNNKEDFEYDDDGGSSRGPINPLPVRTGRINDNNDDDFGENQSPQREDNGSPSVTLVSNSGSGSVKGQPLSVTTNRLSLPRFPSQQINSFVAPLPVVPVTVSARPNVVPVSIATPSAPITVVGKTNLGGDSSGSLPRLVRPAEPTKTVRIVKTRVIRPNPVTIDSASLSSGIKSSQVNPTVTRVIRPVLVARQPQPVPVTPVFQPIITSGSSGPNTIVPGGVKTVPFVANSKVQPPRLRVITTQRPTISVAPVDIDEDASAGSRPAPVQISGVKTIAAANPVPLVPLARLTPTRTLVQPVVQQVRQPSRLQVVYADERLSTQDEDDEDENAAGLSQSNRPLAPIPVRAVPQPYLVPLNVQPSRPLQSRPNFVPTGGKTNTFKSYFNARPQPVPVAPTLVPVAPVQPAPTRILIDSGSASGSRSIVAPISKVQPPRLQVIAPQRPTLVSQVVDEDGLASGVKGSAVTSGSRSIVRPVLVRTPPPTTRPLVQVQEEPLPTFQQIDLIRTQPAPRPFPTFQEQTKSLPIVPVVQPAPRPQTVQPIVQIRDGASSAELPLPPPPRPIQIVRVTPAPTARPITQITQIRESALPSVQPVQVSQPRLIPVAPQPQVVQVSEPARPLTQIRESSVPLFQPLDPALRPAIPTVQVTSQVQEAAAPRELVVPQPVRPVQVIQPQQRLIQVNQVQQPSITETVQLKETSIPITSSQSSLGGQRFARPQPVQTIVTQVPQEPEPAPQPFEILRLREPSFPQFQFSSRQPQPIVPVRPQLIQATVPTQTFQANLPVSRPNLVQISQEKETVSLPQPAPVIIQQQPQQRQVVSLPTIQQVRPSITPVTNVQFVQQQIAQPRPLVRQPSIPRLVAPLPLPQPGQEAQSLGQPITVQNRQPTLFVQQQQRPTFVFSQPQPQPQPQPSPLIVQRQRPVAVAPVVPVAPLSIQNSLSQPGEQQLVQIREKVSSIPDQFSQIEQIRLARA